MPPRGAETLRHRHGTEWAEVAWAINKGVGDGDNNGIPVMFVDD